MGLWHRGPKFVSERLASDVGVSPRMGCGGLCFAEVHCNVGDVGTIPGERHEARLQESTKNAVSRRAWASF
jgi:hypothetical protein